MKTGAMQLEYAFSGRTVAPSCYIRAPLKSKKARGAREEPRQPEGRDPNGTGHSLLCLPSFQSRALGSTYCISL
jgi:hypothetical protein